MLLLVIKRDDKKEKRQRKRKNKTSKQRNKMRKDGHTDAILVSCVEICDHSNFIGARKILM